MTKERIQMSIQTVKDNIAILESQEPEDAGYYLQLEHEKFVLSALEKQIPKKPTPHKVDVEKIKIGNANWCKGTTIYYCPNCKDFISRTYTYCHKCGQALDWGDSE